MRKAISSSIQTQAFLNAASAHSDENFLCRTKRFFTGLLCGTQGKSLQYGGKRAIDVRAVRVQRRLTLSAPELHRIMPKGSRALPPVGTFTPPRRPVFRCVHLHHTIFAAKMQEESFAEGEKCKHFVYLATIRKKVLQMVRKYVYSNRKGGAAMKKRTKEVWL